MIVIDLVVIINVEYRVRTSYSAPVGSNDGIGGGEEGGKSNQIEVNENCNHKFPWNKNFQRSAINYVVSGTNS